MKEYNKISIKGSDNFFFLSDGKQVIYCEKNKYDDTVRVSSIHKPSTKVGTGYVLDEYATLTAHVIDNFLSVLLPNWADRSDIDKVKKYRDIEEFISYEKQFFGEKVIVENVTYN